MEANVKDELVTASDATLVDAITHADPLILRGLLYQLTGDETLTSMPVENVVFGYSRQDRLANADDVELVRAKTIAWLKDLRDSGARRVSIGPMDRLPRSRNIWKYMASKRLVQRRTYPWSRLRSASTTSGSTSPLHLPGRA